MTTTTEERRTVWPTPDDWLVLLDRFGAAALGGLAAHAVAAVDFGQPQAAAEYGFDIALLPGLFARAVHVVFYAGIAREIAVDILLRGRAFDVELACQPI